VEVMQVENLTKDYGHGRGVFDVSFAIDKGEVFGFLGPNGAGKSTTIRHLMGFSKPQSGQVKIFGMPTFDRYDRILSKVGYIPGEIALPQGLTGWEFVSMMQSMQKICNKPMLDKLLDTFELDDKALRCETKHMSLGTKRKLAIVTAFMHDPEVLVLDEPTSGLDPVMQDNFVEFVKNEKERGKTILLSSHIFSEVDATCDRIAIIKDGRIVDRFVANDLKHASRKVYSVDVGKGDFEKFLTQAKQSDFLQVLENDGQKNVLVCTDDKYINSVVSFLSRFDVLTFENQKETLEDYFMKFYKQDKDFGGV